MKPIKENKSGEEAAYRKLCTVLQQKHSGITVADMTAATALPLSRVEELLPRAADEFSARLSVTESGQIIYSFPRGFTSRYRGPGIFAKKFAEKFRKLLISVSSFLFKIWIMVMLIGYFVLFIAIATASLFLSVAVQSKNSGGRRRTNVFFGPNVFHILWRFWFYSEITKSYNRTNYSQTGREKQKTRPMHKAIFSFIFGDEDPNRDWENRTNKAVIAYIQAHKGIISLPEFMSISGKDPDRAAEELMRFCVEFSGNPEATEDGTIIYRFNELLLRANKQDRSFSSMSPPIAALKKFSENKKAMNIGFSLINSVNLLFGSYFIYNAINYGRLYTGEEFKIKTIYEFCYAMLSMVSSNPLPILGIGLGLVPLVFSLLFWLIPCLRYYLSRKENETIKLENLKRLGFNYIWTNPLNVKAEDINSELAECKPQKMNAAQEMVIKDMGSYSLVDVEHTEKEGTVYSFNELAREKQTLEKCRSSVSDDDFKLGSLVFDSDE